MLKAWSYQLIGSCTGRPNLLIHSSSNSDFPSNTGYGCSSSTSLASPLHFLAKLHQFSTAIILNVQSVLLLNQKFRTRWKAVAFTKNLKLQGAPDSLMDFEVAHFVRLAHHFGPRPNQKPAPSQTAHATAHSSTSPWKSWHCPGAVISNCVSAKPHDIHFFQRTAGDKSSLFTSWFFST